MKTLFLSLLLTSVFALPAHAVTRKEVINNVADNVIVKTYKNLADSAVVLKKSIDTLIAKPTQKNLEIAQKNWIIARGDYEGSEGYLFGPIDSLGIDPMIDTWPLELGDMKAILASNQKLDMDFMRSLNSNVLGFHSIEFLLFGEGIKTNTKDVKTFTKREFDYLRGASILLAEQTNLLYVSWVSHSDPEDTNSPAYVDIVKNPGADNTTYSSEEAVIEQLAGSMTDILNEASGAKLPDATGTDIENANASLEESPFSWNSINDYVSNINSVLSIYTGNGLGLKNLVADKDKVLAETIEAKIISCRTLIENVRGPKNVSFGQAIKTLDGRERIFKAIDGLKELQAMLENDMMPVLK